MTAVAIVESPLQVLGLVDALLAEDVSTATVVVRTEAARATLHALTPHVAARLRLDVRSSGSWPGPGGARRAPLVLGDALSGVAQTHLLASRHRSDVLVLDDGTATLLVVDALLGRAPLVRAHVPATARRSALAAAATAILLRRARAGHLTLRTCLPLPDNDVIALAREGVNVVRHTLDHVRSLDVGSSVTEDIVVLGSALADDGLVDAGAYEAWLARTVDDALRDGSTVRYLAHRREPTARLAGLASRGVSVDTVPLPAELRLHGAGLRGAGPHGAGLHGAGLQGAGLRGTGGDGAGGVRRVVSLPTSVLLTVGAALATDGVTIDAQAVPDHWWTARASTSLRAHLDVPRALLTRAVAQDPAHACAGSTHPAAPVPEPSPAPIPIPTPTEARPV